MLAVRQLFLGYLVGTLNKPWADIIVRLSNTRKAKKQVIAHLVKVTVPLKGFAPMQAGS
jgi:hypothetical protein